jgi:hypothetical protein
MFQCYMGTCICGVRIPETQELWRSPDGAVFYTDDVGEPEGNMPIYCAVGGYALDQAWSSTAPGRSDVADCAHK